MTGRVAMLHIVSRSPVDRTVLERTSPGDSLLLIGNAVIAARSQAADSTALQQSLGRLRVFVLGPDLAARAIDAMEVLEGVEIVDYEGFVQLAVDNPVIHSWR